MEPNNIKKTKTNFEIRQHNKKLNRLRVQEHRRLHPKPIQSTNIQSLTNEVASLKTQVEALKNRLDLLENKSDGEIY
jgi:ubiquinone biosynthesis protein UbiJ